MSIAKSFSIGSLLLSLSAGAAFADDSVLTVDSSNSPYIPNVNPIPNQLFICNDPAPWEGDEAYSKVIIKNGGFMDLTSESEKQTQIDTTDVNFTAPTKITADTVGLRMLIEEGGTFSTAHRVVYHGGIISIAGTLNSTDTIAMGDSGQDLFFKVEKTGVVNANSISMFVAGQNCSKVQVEGKLKTYTLDVGANTGQVALEVLNGGSLDVESTLTHTYGIVKIGSDSSNVTVNVGAMDSLVATPTGTNPDLYKDYVDIAKGSTLTIKGTSISSMRGVQLAGTLNIESGITEINGNAGLSFQGGTLNIKSGATLKAGEKVSDYLFSLHNGTNKINVYGTGENAGKFTTFDSNNQSKGIRLNDYNSTSAQSVLELWAESEGAVQTHAVTFIKNAKLILKSKHVIQGRTGKTSVTLGSNTKAEIDVYADNIFSNVSIQLNSYLTLNLMDKDAELGFSEFTEGYNYAPMVNLTINEFQNNRLFFTKVMTLETFQSLVGDLDIYTKYGDKTKAYSFDDITFDAFDHEEYGSIWYLNIAGYIPEPAEWAAIFGGIALALAMLRKRSKK